MHEAYPLQPSSPLHALQLRAPSALAAHLNACLGFWDQATVESFLYVLCFDCSCCLPLSPLLLLLLLPLELLLLLRFLLFLRSHMLLNNGQLIWALSCSQ